jgi:hypothetical protein
MAFAQVEEMVAVVFVATEAEPEVRQATQNGLLREGGVRVVERCVGDAG